MKNKTNKYYRIGDDYDYPQPGEERYCYSDPMEFSRIAQDMMRGSIGFMRFFEMTGNFIENDEENLEDEGDVVIHVITVREMNKEEIRALNPNNVRTTHLRGRG